MPMTEHYISASRFIAVSAWCCTWCLVVAGWLVLLMLHRSGLAAMLGLTAGVAAVPAGVLSVRCYFIRLGRLVRTTAGLLPTEEPTAELHVVR